MNYRRHHASCRRSPTTGARGGWPGRGGYTLLELSVSVSLFVVVLLSSLALVERDTRLSRSTLSISTVEMLAQEMLFDIERELSNAQGSNPEAILVADLSASDDDVMLVDSTLGFPSAGILLLDRGAQTEERIEYASLGADQVSFLGLTRGVGCTGESDHLAGGELISAGLAEPIELQDDPPPETWDGQAEEVGGVVFFRGDGCGYTYRVPVDPFEQTGQKPNYLDGDELRWGAVVDATATEDGWCELTFVPSFEVSEVKLKNDLNQDGDTSDTFDIGQIRRRRWNTADPTIEPDDYGMGPTAVLQEQCNWGGDLDGDGFDDPLFLWDKDTRELRVRLFVIGLSLPEMPIVRRVESLMFLRNEQEL